MHRRHCSAIGARCYHVASMAERDEVQIARWDAIRDRIGDGRCRKHPKRGRYEVHVRRPVQQPREQDSAGERQEQEHADPQRYGKPVDFRLRVFNWHVRI